MADKTVVLLTGGGGTLCQTLGPLLMQSGAFEVRTFDRRFAHGVGHCHYQGDLTRLPDVITAMEGVEMVVHAGALHGVWLDKLSREDFWNVNVTGTFNVLEAARLCGVRRVIFISSTSVYGHSCDPRDGRAAWITEETPLAPRDIYDLTKVIGEELCQRWATMYDRETWILRPSRFFYDNLVASNVRKLYRGVDVRDVARAVQLALMVDPGLHNTVNIVAETRFRPEDCRQLYENPGPVIERYYPGTHSLFMEMGWKLPSRIGRVYQVDRARQILGFSSMYNFEHFLDTVRETLQSGNLLTEPHPVMTEVTV